MASYVNKDQYLFFNENLKTMIEKMSEHSFLVDEIEKKLIQINKKRE